MKAVNNELNEDHRYAFDLIHSNRARFLFLSSILIVLFVILLLHKGVFTAVIIEAGHFTAYLVIYSLMLFISIVALVYGRFTRKKTVNVPLESAFQISVFAVLIWGAAASAVLDSIYGWGFTTYLLVAVISGLLVRHRVTAVYGVYIAGAGLISFLYFLEFGTFDGPFVIRTIVYSAIGLALFIVRERDYKESYQVQLQLVEQSIIDPLTDVYNRRFFIEELERSVQRRKRYGHRFCLALIDIDGFRQINDSLGYLVGDTILEAYSWKLMDLTRESDVVGRYGGDEFMMLLSETTIEQALPVVERLREHFEKYEFEGINRTLTCSIGIVECDEESDTNDLISRADELTNKAGKSGGNAVLKE